MKSKAFAVCGLSAVLAVLMGQAAVADVVMNGGFENPVLSGGVIAAPADSGWTFTVPDSGTGEAGMLSSSAAADWGASPIGSQCAVFYGTATIGQTFNVPTATTDATFTFSAQEHSSVTDGVLTATLDGIALTFGSVGSVDLTGTMAAYTSDAIAVGAGTHTLQFQVNKWSFLDGVSSNIAVPEPSSIALLSAGMLGLLAYAWRKRK